MIVIITSMESLPDHCYECPCHNGEHCYCQADKERRYSDYRPYWCPLKEIHDIVRCRECRRKGTYDCPIYAGSFGNFVLPDEWYCADGEKAVKVNADD